MKDKFRFLIFLVFIFIVQNNPSSSYADIVINEIVTDAVGSDTGCRIPDNTRLPYTLYHSVYPIPPNTQYPTPNTAFVHCMYYL